MMTTEPPAPTSTPRVHKARTLSLLIVCMALFVVIAYVGLHQVTKFIDPEVVAVYLLFAVAAGYLASHFWWLVTADTDDEARAITAAYEKLARVLALVAAGHPAVLAQNDPDEPDYWVLYLDTDKGQVTWHVLPENLRLFPHIEQVSPDDPRAQWDGHTPDEKNLRLAALVENAR